MYIRIYVYMYICIYVGRHSSKSHGHMHDEHADDLIGSRWSMTVLPSGGLNQMAA